jgi:hypothetical protein
MDKDLDDFFDLNQEINYKLKSFQASNLHRMKINPSKIQSKFKNLTVSKTQRNQYFILIKSLFSFDFMINEFHFIMHYLTMDTLELTKQLHHHKKQILFNLKFMLEFLLFYKNSNLLLETVETFLLLFSFLDSKLKFEYEELKLISSLIIGTVLCYYQNENSLQIILKLPDTETIVSDDDEFMKLLLESVKNNENLILILGGILQANSQLIEDERMGVNLMISIFNKLYDLIQYNASSQVIIFSFQTLNCYFRVLVKHPFVDLIVKSEITGKAIDLVIQNWNNVIVSKQKLKEIFGFLMDSLIASSVGKDKIEKIMILLVDNNQKTKAFYEILSIMIPKIKLADLLSIIPNIHLESVELLLHPILNSFISSFLIQFVKKAKIEYNSQFDRILSPNSIDLQLPKLMNLILSILSEKDSKLHAEKTVLLLIKIEPKILFLLVDGLDYKEKNECYYDAMLQVTKFSIQTGMDHLIKYKELVKVGISSSDINLQSQSFLILLESKNPTFEQLKMIKLFLINQSIKGNDFDLRMTIDAKLKRFLESLKRLIYKGYKAVSNLQKKAIFYCIELGLDHSQYNPNDIDLTRKFDFLSPEIDSINTEIITINKDLDEKLDFFNFLLNYCYFNTFPTPNFYRKIKTKNLLLLINQTNNLSIDKGANLKIPSVFNLNDRLKKSLFYQIIFEGFGEIRKDLMTIFQNIQYDLPKNLNRLVENLLVLFKSIRAADVDIMSSLTNLIYTKFVVGMDTVLYFNGSAVERNQYNPSEFFVKQILEILERHVQVAEIDMIKSSLHFPLNGICNVLE